MIELNYQQREDLRIKLQEECGVYFFGEELEKAIKIFSEVCEKPKAFSDGLQKEETYERDMSLYGDNKDKDSDDLKRFGKTSLKIFNLMRDGDWRTPEQIKETLNLTPSVTSIAITLRSYREKRYGAHTLDKKRTGKGMQYRYQLRVNTSSDEFNNFLHSQLSRL